MFNTINQVWIDTYKDNLIHSLQQKDSRLVALVSNDTMRGEKTRFNYIGKAAMHEKTDKGADTVFDDLTFWNRWISRRRFLYDTLLDQDEDIENLATNPTSDIVKAAMMAAKRQKDIVIVNAFFGTAWTGKEAETAVEFPDAQKLNIQLGSPSGAPANIGLTLAKILEAKYRFDAAEIDPDEPRYMGVTAYQVKELLNTTEIKNADYNSVKALAEGKIDTFAGFKFIQTEQFLHSDDKTIRYLPAWTQESVKFAVSTDIQVNITVESLKNNSYHPHVEMACGAVRLFDEGVIMVPCAETH